MDIPRQLPHCEHPSPSMAKLDRFPWRSGASFRCMGRLIGIRTNLAEVPRELIERLPPDCEAVHEPRVEILFSFRHGGEARTGSRNFHALYVGVSLALRSFDLDEVIEQFENEAQMAIAEHAAERICVHAGAVAWMGRGLILPGRSMAGKSTLVAALLRRGATYYSDEYAVLDGGGMLHPFPRRLSLRRQGDSPLRVRAGDLGAPTGAAPVPVGLVALTRYDAKSRWSPRTLSPGRAALAVLDNTVAGQSRPLEVMDSLQRLCTRTRVMEGRRGEAEQTADLLLQSLSDSVSHPSIS